MQTSSHGAGWIRARTRLALDSGIPHQGAKFEPRQLALGAGRAAALRLRALLSQRNAAWAIIAISIALCSPAIVSGLLLDDNFHAVVLRSADATAARRAAWNIFSFVPTAAELKQLVEDGVFPWWSDPSARLAFFRPLTSLTHYADYQLWPNSPALMHIHSLLWYGVLLFVVARVYRRLSGRTAALGLSGLALFVYALDDTRAMSVGWIANRGALIALSCGFATLLAHDSWRTTGRRRWLFVALALLGTGLLCAEAAVQAVAYVLAYAAFLDRSSIQSRLRSFAPYAALLFVWHRAYVAMGFGATGTGLYIDPARSSLQFLGAVAQRFPLLLASQFVGLSADLGAALHYAAPSLVALVLPTCLLAIALTVWLFYPLWVARREVRFWTAGTLLSIIPVCAAVPADRLLVGTGLGGSALVATLLLAALDRAPELRSRLRRLLTIGSALVNLVIAPLLLPLQSYALVYLRNYIDRAERSIPDGPEIAHKTVVLLNPPSDEYGVFMSYQRRARGGILPAHTRWLATGDEDLRLSVLDAHTLKLRPRRGFLPPGAFWTLRSPDYRSQVGDTIALADATYTITDVTQDGRPAELLARFDQPIRSDRLVWLRWSEHGGFVPFTLPEPGRSIRIPAVDSASVLDTL